MEFSATEPLGNRLINCSDNDDDTIGNHPYKHGVTTPELRDTVTTPQVIYEHGEHPRGKTRVSHFRKSIVGRPNNQAFVRAIIEYDSPTDGHVVTSYYASYIGGAGVDDGDLRYIGF